jgi:hypothetical protein
MSHAKPAFAWFVLAVAVTAGGCKSAKGPAAADEADDCDPGRCLADISAAVETHRPEARTCYEAGHAVDPTLKGRLIINFEIDPAGTVVDASQSAQENQIEDEAVVTCITDVIMRITFAASPRGKTTKAFHRYEFNPPRP